MLLAMWFGFFVVLSLPLRWWHQSPAGGAVIVALLLYCSRVSVLQFHAGTNPIVLSLS